MDETGCVGGGVKPGNVAVGVNWKIGVNVGVKVTVGVPGVSRPVGKAVNVAVAIGVGGIKVAASFKRARVVKGLRA